MSTDNYEAESKELRYVKKSVSDKFKFLEKNGYRFHSEVKHNNFFIENLEVKYVNEIKKREISVRYTKSNFDAIKYTLSLSIVRTPYISVKDFFSYNEFCRLTGKDLNGTIENLFDEGKADAIIVKFKKFLQTNSAIFIEGAEWVEGYYPK